MVQIHLELRGPDVSSVVGSYMYVSYLICDEKKGESSFLAGWQAGSHGKLNKELLSARLVTPARCEYKCLYYHLLSSDMVPLEASTLPFGHDGGVDTR